MTMAINAFYVYIDFGISFATSAIFRAMDQGWATYFCCRQNKTTKCATIQAYVNLYAGPEHSMAYRYSAILVTSWICLMYGVCMPIMFPIGALTYMNYFIADRLLVAYYFRRPPVYDEKLQRTSLAMMKFAPVLMFFFGYWCLGNVQIFTDNVKPLVNTGVPMVTEHHWYPEGNQALPLFIMGCVCMVIFLFDDFFGKNLSKCHLAASEEDLDMVETAGTFYESMNIFQRKRLYAQELHFRRLGIETMGDHALEKIRTVVGSEQIIENTPTYEILANQTYAAAFQFTPIDLVDT